MAELTKQEEGSYGGDFYSRCWSHNPSHVDSNRRHIVRLLSRDLALHRGDPILNTEVPPRKTQTLNVMRYVFVGERSEGQIHGVVAFSRHHLVGQNISVDLKSSNVRFSLFKIRRSYDLVGCHCVR